MGTGEARPTVQRRAPATHFGRLFTVFLSDEAWVRLCTVPRPSLIYLLLSISSNSSEMLRCRSDGKREKGTPAFWSGKKMCHETKINIIIELMLKTQSGTIPPLCPDL